MGLVRQEEEASYSRGFAGTTHQLVQEPLWQPVALATHMRN